MLLVNFVQQLSTILPREPHALQQAYENGSDTDCWFVQRLALFLGTYLKSFLSFFEAPNGQIQPMHNGMDSTQPQLLYHEIVLESLHMMLRVSEVEDEEVFKTCLEFWSHFAKELYIADVQFKTSAGSTSGTSGQTVFGNSGSMGSSSLPPTPSTLYARPKHAVFEQVLHNLRIIVIDRMAKPEEVGRSDSCCWSVLMC